jgi:hypothetical protein
MDRSRASVDASAPLRATEQGPDVLVDLEDIAALGGWLDIEYVEPPVRALFGGGPDVAESEPHPRSSGAYRDGFSCA